MNAKTAARLLLTYAAATSACGPRPPPTAPPAHVPADALPDLRVAEGRPPVALVAREGDPSAAVAVAIAVSGIATDGADDPVVATGLAGLLESRLAARGVDAVVTPSWDGVRTSALTASDRDAGRFVEAVVAAVAAPVTEADTPAVRKKLALLGQRPLRDPALARYARCIGDPFSAARGAARPGAGTEIDVATIERWRAGAFGLGRVTFAVTGPPAIGETVAAAVLRGPIWKNGAPLPAPSRSPAAPELAVDVFDTPDTSALGAGPTAYLTLDVGTNSAAVATAAALGDPRGPLAARLSDLDPPFRLREVTGTASVHGGCVGVVLEAASQPSAADLPVRVADAVALVRLEASVELESGVRDGRALSRRSGDARESAELGAWWALSSLSSRGERSGGGSIALGLPSRRGAKENPTPPSRDALASAVERATAAWDRPVVEGRSRVELGQGEVWVLIASPCGTDDETDADTGLSALVAATAAATVHASGDVRVEPWSTADGTGLVVHGPSLMGESPLAHARRLADIATRNFGAEPLSASTIARARADLLRRETRGGAGLAVLASALAPQHPSWVVPSGTVESLARSSDGAVALRAQALRAGPLRLAVLANDGPAQAEAAVRAADRWASRRTGDLRSCRPLAAAHPPRPGTYAATPRPGAVPEAYLAFPFPPGDEAARNAAALLADALDDDARQTRADATPSLLDKALGGIALESSARVLGWPRAPALVVRVVAAQASLDAAVMQTRALVDRVHTSGLAATDYDRAVATAARLALATSLDPRARLVATWHGESSGAGPRARASLEEIRGFARRYMGEESLVVVAARPPRPAGAP